MALLLCPNCGNPLTLTLGNSDAAPFCCFKPAGCSRAWFRCELTDAGRKLWDHVRMCHPMDEGLDGQREGERSIAFAFGFNVRPSEVMSMTQNQVAAILTTNLGVSPADHNPIIAMLRLMELGQITQASLTAQLTSLGYAALAQRLCYSMSLLGMP